MADVSATGTFGTGPWTGTIGEGENGKIDGITQTVGTGHKTISADLSAEAVKKSGHLSLQTLSGDRQAVRRILYSRIVREQINDPTVGLEAAFLDRHAVC